jgi:hypothetical protein
MKITEMIFVKKNLILCAQKLIFTINIPKCIDFPPFYFSKNVYFPGALVEKFTTYKTLNIAQLCLLFFSHEGTSLFCTLDTQQSEETV